MCEPTAKFVQKQQHEQKKKYIKKNLALPAEAQNENDNNNAAAGVQLFDMPRFAW